MAQVGNARIFLAGDEEDIASLDAPGLAESPLLKVGAFVIAHFQNVQHVGVFGPGPGNQPVHIGVTEDLRMDVIVSGIPTPLGHLHPALGTVGPLGGFTRADRDSVLDHQMFDTAQDGHLPVPGGDHRVDTTGNDPIVARGKARKLHGSAADGASAARSLRVELPGQVKGGVGPSFAAVQEPFQSNHGGG